jgi:regulatory protein YycI of two-component signal transduction system YycFG
MTIISTRSITITVLFLLVLVAALLLFQHRSTAAGVARVQYRVLESLPLDNAKLEAQLNEYGQTGWELVLVDIGNVTKPAPRFIFKRVELP